MIDATTNAARAQWRVVYLSVLAAGFAALSAGQDAVRESASWGVALSGIVIGCAALQIRIALRQDRIANARPSAAIWRTLAVTLLAIAVGFVTLGVLAVWHRATAT